MKFKSYRKVVDIIYKKELIIIRLPEIIKTQLNYEFKDNSKCLDD